MKTLPATVAHYKTSSEFNQDTVPQALQRTHTTADNVWGRIVVHEGSLRYTIEEPEAEQHLLSPGIFGIVEPQVPHHVEVIGPVRFSVEFHR
ncbi:DUF1971 domain-containing protein [Massilia glaciei]|uniref:DUF1971 domain-containing protein n=1 Tax=Massilia glaciei TaxID=1524097 RepID=A0A2U2HHQ0_9BURK|nr:DUF1971 domain-containing protein [Massilia glaciei]PWF45450.1 DUF1971 domain-containing protein [Massilia glaciei]